VGTKVAVGRASRVSMGIIVGVGELDVDESSLSVGKGVGDVPFTGTLHEVNTKTITIFQR
jgi:hypothetical protein